ncbi:transaldolase [Candidatus Roizmanbacteria bacterium]|nr:transaldolase [Candidatus Roizmanbacteria bacterium]
MAITLPKIFLDSGDPEETKKVRSLLGFVDGQTTNPSLIAKNPEVQKLIASGKRLTEKDLLGYYHEIIQEISRLIPGPVSAEVYADWETPASQLLKQAEEMTTWGRNIYVKFPVIPEGLKAAHEFVLTGGKVNMTLVFDQIQAGAVYSAVREAKFPSFVSPFIGRWDDRGINGLDLVKNILRQYKGLNRELKRPSQVEVLAASIRTLDHFYACIFMGADILTVPLKILTEWIHDEQWIPDEHYRVATPGLRILPYQHVPFRPDYTQYLIENVPDSLLSQGLEKFISDWKKLTA